MPTRLLSSETATSRTKVDFASGEFFCCLRGRRNHHRLFFSIPNDRGSHSGSVDERGAGTGVDKFSWSDFYSRDAVSCSSAWVRFRRFCSGCVFLGISYFVALAYSRQGCDRFTKWSGAGSKGVVLGSFNRGS